MIKKNSDEFLDQNFIISLVEKKILSDKSLGISKKNLKTIYNKAKHLYEAGKYKESRSLFSTLSLLERKNPTFIFGLGSACMMMNDYDSAIAAFLHYTAVAPNDPAVYFYLSTCFEKKQDLPSALVALQTVVQCAGDKPSHRDMKNRALLVLEKFKKKESK